MTSGQRAARDPDVVIAYTGHTLHTAGGASTGAAAQRCCRMPLTEEILGDAANPAMSQDSM